MNGKMQQKPTLSFEELSTTHVLNCTIPIYEPREIAKRDSDGFNNKTLRSDLDVDLKNVSFPQCWIFNWTCC